MRNQGSPSELGRLAAPVLRVIDGAWQRMHWWVGAMAVFYLLSGITIIQPDEVAVVLRWGKLVGDTPALQQHGSGLLFSFPRPIDRVVRVRTKQVRETSVGELGTQVFDEDEPPPVGTLDPVLQGYALTGDNNVVHVIVVARYRVRDPGEWAFYGPNSVKILRVEVTEAIVRSLGEMPVDRVLSDGRKALIDIAAKRAQAGLDAAHSGLELSSLELTGLNPPIALASEFDAVQSAYIGAETKRKDAQAFAERVVPQAQSDANTTVQLAQGSASAALAKARGDAQAFIALDHEYKTNPVVVRERLYREGVEKALGSAGKVRWIPPPTGGNYRGFRIQISPGDAGFGGGFGGVGGDDDDR